MAPNEQPQHSERWDEIWSAKQRLASGRLTSGLTKDVIYRTVVGILRREVPDARGKHIIEVGSGTGLASLWLAERGARVTLCDISPEALKFSEAVFAEARSTLRARAQAKARARDEARGQSADNSLAAEMVQGSILDLPFEDDSFDVTWNAGVVEHFEGEEQLRALREMLRVTRPEGRVVVAVPWAGAGIYLRAKKFADSRGAWQPGYEVPIATFKDIAPQLPATLLHEYATGYLAQLHFLKYYFSRIPALRLAWVGLAEALSVVLSPLNRRPGYLLVAAMQKRAAH
jgi:SAM-dependent methyltransferase